MPQWSKQQLDAIDEMVYSLYGLSKDDIQIVEDIVSNS
jgi:hypothetical protein